MLPRSALPLPDTLPHVVAVTAHMYYFTRSQDKKIESMLSGFGASNCLTQSSQSWIVQLWASDSSHTTS